MKRRQFITFLGGAAALPVAARAQQPAMPVIGFLSLAGLMDAGPLANVFRRGLGESGYVEGRNVTVDYRWTDGKYDQLTEFIAEFVRRRVAVIALPASMAAALAAKAATSEISIVFGVGDDPVKAGLVTSFNRPGGNATGVSYLTQELGEKRLDLLRDVMPRGGLVAVLINPNNTVVAEAATKEIQAAARRIGQKIEFFHASDGREIDAAFAALEEKGANALLLYGDPLFTSRRVQIATLAARHGIPAIYNSRDYVEAGGLMSYGTNTTDRYYQVGIYAGRILAGAKPADLPVERPTKIELLINLNTAKALKLAIPPSLLAIADEVIE